MKEAQLKSSLRCSHSVRVAGEVEKTPQRLPGQQPLPFLLRNILSGQVASGANLGAVFQGWH